MKSKDYKIKVSVIGTAPIIFDRYIGQVPEESKRAQKVYDPIKIAESKTYRTSKGKMYIPSAHFKAAMKKSAVDFKMNGNKSYKDYISSGVFINENEIILSPQNYDIHTESVVINRARVMSWRPRVNIWSCTFTLNVVDEMINLGVLREILEAAGKYKGVGAHRPEYGRFNITEFKMLKDGK